MRAICILGDGDPTGKARACLQQLVLSQRSRDKDLTNRVEVTRCYFLLSMDVMLPSFANSFSACSGSTEIRALESAFQLVLHTSSSQIQQSRKSNFYRREVESS